MVSRGVASVAHGGRDAAAAYHYDADTANADTDGVWRWQGVTERYALP